MCDCIGPKKYPARVHIVDGRVTWYAPWCGECFNDVGILIGEATPEAEDVYNKAWRRPGNGFTHACSTCGQPTRRGALVWEGAEEGGLLPIYFSPGTCDKLSCIEQSDAQHVLIGYRKA